MCPDSNSDRATCSTGAAVAPQTEGDADAEPAAAYASPACFLHEVDASYRGYLSRDEIVGLLNELLEGERAGAKLAGVLGKSATRPEIRAFLHDLGSDEARFCAMLSRQIERLEGAPSRATSKFYEKVLVLDTLNERLTLLNAGQRWVVRTLREALPRIEDDALRADLLEMIEVHERNNARAAPFAT